MGGSWGLLWLLLGGCSGLSSHSLRHFYWGVTDPGQGLPWFTHPGYVDDQLFVQYDSNRRKLLPRPPWMEKIVQKVDPQYLERETQFARAAEQFFKEALVILQNRYNQSGGIHTWQCLVGCELSKDGHKRRYMNYAYDGRDFISFNKETLTWTAADVAAQVTKRKWEGEPSVAKQWKSYLEEECVWWLQKLLEYGNETLLREVPPKVHVKSKAEDDGLETFVFRFHGFYPKEMDVTWMKDGEVWTQDTFRGRVAPNSDGTYYTWHSITIHPKEKDRYRCHVEHDSLLEPLDLAVEDSAVPGSVPVGVILGSVLGVLAAFNLLIVGIVLYKKRQEKPGYSPASTSHHTSASSSEGFLSGEDKLHSGLGNGHIA